MPEVAWRLALVGGFGLWGGWEWQSRPPSRAPSADVADWCRRSPAGDFQHGLAGDRRTEIFAIGGLVVGNAALRQTVDGRLIETRHSTQTIHGLVHHLLADLIYRLGTSFANRIIRTPACIHNCTCDNYPSWLLRIRRFVFINAKPIVIFILQNILQSIPGYFCRLLP